MCGIAGLFRLRQPFAGDSVIVDRMAQALAHRGPDAHGVFSAGLVSLGHRRLSIIDPDPRSNQPFTDASGRYTLVFNGQIYNFWEIRALLYDYPFRTSSDTEVIVAAYAKWKEKCLDRMNGMFAFAIYDATDKSLFLARDRLGVKPLYYSMSGDVFVFASEIRAILASGLVRREISETGLLEYLMFQASVGPNTILTDIRQLSPGHYAYIRNETFTETRYWTFGASFSGEVGDKPAVLSATRELLLRSVERRLVSDVPLGAFLSGGIDSSLIVAAMAEVSAEVNTFSITFEERDYDESQYSRLVAARYRTNHHPILLRATQFLEELPEALDAMDSPSADGMNTYVIAKVTKKAGITVALSGVGGDELFAGYHYFRQWQQLKRYGFFSMPQAVRKLALKLVESRLSESWMERLSKLALADGTIARTYPVFRQVLGDAVALRLIKGTPTDSRNTLSQEIDAAEPARFSYLSRFSIAELCGYARNVLLKDTDQFGMASALEVREPYFDYELIDFVVQVPDKWKFGRTPKYLLTAAMRDFLPAEIIKRPKRGFLLPWQYWLRHELADFAKSHIDYLADHRNFDGSRVRETWQAFYTKKGSVSWPQVWQLIALSHWLRKNEIGAHERPVSTPQLSGVLAGQG